MLGHWAAVDRILAAVTERTERYRGLKVFQGGAASKPEQQIAAAPTPVPAVVTHSEE
jgi:hypothetical protein